MEETNFLAQCNNSADVCLFLGLLQIIQLEESDP